MYFPSESGPSPVATAGASTEASKSRFIDSILNANCEVAKQANAELEGKTN